MEHSISLRDRLPMVLSFFVALLLTALPLPGWANWMRPQWCALVLIFWVSVSPKPAGLCAAFLVGLLVDGLTGTLLGMHAFIFVLITYLLLKFHPHLSRFHFFQQAGMIFILAMLNLVLQYCVMSVVHDAPQSWLFWLPAFTSAALWPWVSSLLRELCVSDGL